MTRFTRESVLGTLLTALLVGSAAPAWSLCAAQSMGAKWGWVNVNQAGLLKRLEIRFTCCDTAPCSPGPPAFVRVVGPCETGTCDWGEVAAQYTFVDEASGWPETTRLDARFTSGGQTRELVALLVARDQLLVHWSMAFPDGSADKPFSMVEYFEPRKCFTMGGKVVCLEHYTPSLPALR